MEAKCVRCVVSGRVQGVYYRATAQQRAEALGLRGWARNLPDGSVEVLACGDAGALAELERWLGEGPPRAAVSGVHCRPVEEPDGLAGFEVLR